MTAGIECVVNSGGAAIANGIRCHVDAPAPATQNWGVRTDIVAPGTGSTNHGVESSVWSNQATETAAGYFLANDGNTTGPLYGLYADATANVSSGCPPFACGIYARATTNGTGCNGGAGGSVWAGYFDGDVFGYGFYTVSDVKLKTNIRSYESALDKIAVLHPKQYAFRTNEYPQLGLPHGEQIGLIAEELETVFPELVKETSRPAVVDTKGSILHEAVDFKTVNYTGLIPVLVRGIQEQQEEIEALKQQVADLTNAVKAQAGQAAITINQPNFAKLYQNVPNPTSSATTIRYFLPTNAARAELVITDIDGRVEYKRMPVQTGDGQIELSAGALPPGAYFYSLIVNGASVDSKKMIVTP
jgi:hypothetical protein